MTRGAGEPVFQEPEETQRGPRVQSGMTTIEEARSKDSRGGRTTRRKKDLSSFSRASIPPSVRVLVPLLSSSRILVRMYTKRPLKPALGPVAGSSFSDSIRLPSPFSLLSLSLSLLIAESMYLISVAVKFNVKMLFEQKKNKKNKSPSFSHLRRHFITFYFTRIFSVAVLISSHTKTSSCGSRSYAGVKLQHI